MDETTARFTTGTTCSTLASGYGATTSHNLASTKSSVVAHKQPPPPQLQSKDSTRSGRAFGSAVFGNSSSSSSPQERSGEVLGDSGTVEADARSNVTLAQGVGTARGLERTGSGAGVHRAVECLAACRVLCCDSGDYLLRLWAPCAPGAVRQACLHLPQLLRRKTYREELRAQACLSNKTAGVIGSPA